MNKIKLIYSKSGKGFYKTFRKLFDSYSSVKIMVNNKTYDIVPGGTVQIINYKITSDDIVHEIVVPNALAYNKSDSFLKKQVGKKFDYFGATLGQVFGLGYQDENKWFDSELVCKFLQFCLFEEVMAENPSKVSLEKLFEKSQKIVDRQLERKLNVTLNKPDGISKKISELKDKVIKEELSKNKV